MLLIFPDYNDFIKKSKSLWIKIRKKHIIGTLYLADGDPACSIIIIRQKFLIGFPVYG